MPQITLLPSFGEVLSPDEKLSNQSILVSTSGIENTQSVSIAITNNPNISYVQAISNNSTIVSVPTSDLQQLKNGKSYEITASIQNIFGDTAISSFNFTVSIPAGSVGGGGTIFIKDENIPVGIVTSLNFTGLGVTASITNNVANVNIDGDFDGGGFTD
jgi:hypothetical protein